MWVGGSFTQQWADNGVGGWGGGGGFELWYLSYARDVGREEAGHLAYGCRMGVT